jgi:hypothetical protein
MKTTRTQCRPLVGVAFALLGHAAAALAEGNPRPAAVPPARVEAVADTTSRGTHDLRNAAGQPTKPGSVVVRRGDSLERIITRHLTHLPFRQDILRQAVIKKNPAAFKGGRPEGLLVGAILQLPATEDFNHLFSGATAAAPPPAQPPVEDAPTDIDPRKSWVRFP